MSRKLIKKREFQASDFVQLDNSDFLVYPNGEIFVIIYEARRMNPWTEREIMRPGWIESVEPHLSPKLWEEVLLRSNLIERDGNDR